MLSPANLHVSKAGRPQAPPMRGVKHVPSLPCVVVRMSISWLGGGPCCEAQATTPEAPWARPLGDGFVFMRRFQFFATEERSERSPFAKAGRGP